MTDSGSFRSFHCKPSWHELVGLRASSDVPVLLMLMLMLQLVLTSGEYEYD